MYGGVCMLCRVHIDPSLLMPPTAKQKLKVSPLENALCYYSIIRARGLQTVSRDPKWSFFAIFWRSPVVLKNLVSKKTIFAFI